MKLINQIQANLDYLDLSSNDVRRSLIAAQKEILISIQDPTLLLTNFDLVLEHLHDAIEFTESKFEKNEIRKKTSYMIHSMAFFFRAKYLYEVNKRNEEGKKLIEQGCEMLSKSLHSISENPTQYGLAISGQQLSNSFFEGENSFFKRITLFFIRDKEIKKQKDSYVKFIERLIPKLERNFDMIGKSNLVSELISEHKEEVLDYRFPSPKFSMTKIKGLIYFLVIINLISWFFWFLISIFSGIGSFFREVFNIKKEGLSLAEAITPGLYNFSMFSVILIFLVICGAFFVFLLKNIKNENSKNKKNRYYESVIKMYTN